jgi:hypothetical protein
MTTRITLFIATLITTAALALAALGAASGTALAARWNTGPHWDGTRAAAASTGLALGRVANGGPGWHQ